MGVRCGRSMLCHSGEVGMRCRRSIHFAVAFHILTTGSTFLAGTALADQLLFEPIGEQDAALRPFALEAGRLADSTRDVVHVTPDVFRHVLALVRQAHAARARGCPDFPAFQAAHLRDGGSVSEYRICSGDVVVVFGSLIAMFREQHEPVPEWLAGVESSLGRRP